MTRCTNRNTFTAESGALFGRLMAKGSIAAMLVFIPAGCRNTTTAPMGPIGSAAPLSPLSPVQGTAPLSPIQPTSGVSALGAPTRVPPPPTGSYGATNSTYPAQSNYGPTSSWTQPAPSALTATGLAPGGATLDSKGMTRGVTELNPLRSPTGVASNGAVRQTAWVSDNATGDASIANPASPSRAAAPPTNDPTALVRAGGMQPIDLTQAPFPPGYVPPQQRPGAASFPQTMPYPQAASAASQTANASVSLGQPKNWTTERSSSSSSYGAGFSDTGYSNSSAVQTAGRISDGNLPSTEPYTGNDASPDTGHGGSQPLQWRRPSPRF